MKAAINYCTSFPRCCLLVLVFALISTSHASVTGSITKEPHQTKNDAEAPYMILRLDPEAKPISPPIPPDFASFSFEWWMADLLGNSKSFQTLLQYLQFGRTGQGPNLRIGGNSADQTWWWDDNNPRDPSKKCSASYDPKYCILHNMTKDTLLSVYQMAEALNATLILNLNMVQNNTADWAAEEMKGVLETLGPFSGVSRRIEGIELGNEPDLFGEHGQRYPQYSHDDFEKEFQMYLARLYHNRDMIKYIRGGTYCCERPFLDRQKYMMYHYQPFFYSYSYHTYPTSACNQHRPTIRQLLSDASSDGIGKRVVDWANYANSLGIAFHLGETNSMSCSGISGVSDTMASALWALDYMFVLVTNNVSRANFHGGGHAPYSWFFINKETDVPTVNPLYYSLVIWNLMTTVPGASTYVVPMECRGGIGCKKDGNIRVKTWATRDDKGNANIIILNKLLNQTEPIQIQLQAYHDVGNVFVLQGQNGMASQKNLTFSGWTWEGTTDGTVQGKLNPTELHPKMTQSDEFGNKTYVYEVKVEPATAALISFHGGEGGPLMWQRTK